MVSREAAGRLFILGGYQGFPGLVADFYNYDTLLYASSDINEFIQLRFQINPYYLFPVHLNPQNDSSQWVFADF